MPFTLQNTLRSRPACACPACRAKLRGSPAEPRDCNSAGLRRVFGAGVVLLLFAGPSPGARDFRGVSAEPPFREGRASLTLAGDAHIPIPRRLQHYDHGDPDDYEQMMLELINRTRADPAAEAARHGIDLNADLDGDAITAAPKPPLAFNARLTDAARAHSAWMLETDTFDHEGVGGSDPGERMEAAGHPFAGSYAWGENIAYGATTGAIDAGEEAVSLHAALFLSPGHRLNICHPVFEEIGIGIVTGVFTFVEGDYNTAMATQKYAFSGGTPGPLALGVVFNDANGNGSYDPGEGVAGVTVSVEGGDRQTLTSSSGGYALPYGNGEGPVRLIFSGGPISGALIRETERTGENVKIDLETGAIAETELFTVNGVPILWLEKHGLATDGSDDFTDSDGDGFDNRQEWLAGTDPRDAGDFPRMFALEVDEADILVRWRSASGRVYRIERGFDLTAQPPFTFLQGGLPGVEGIGLYRDTNPPAHTALYYRVAVEALE